MITLQALRSEHSVDLQVEQRDGQTAVWLRSVGGVLICDEVQWVWPNIITFLPWPLENF